MLKSLIAHLVAIQLVLVQIECIGRGIFFHHGSNNLEPEKSPLTSNNSNDFIQHGFKNTSEMTVLDYNNKYYQQTVLRAEHAQIIDWIDLDNKEAMKNQNKSHEVIIDSVLSSNYLNASLVWLSFKFPFYGHLIDRILVTNVGFLYVGTLFNQNITHSQYIAPLMANFDITIDKNSSVRYVDNKTHFVCSWENLVLKDQPGLGEYTFQVVLGIDGKIIFNYKSIPSMDIENSDKRVKMGFSDAFMDFKHYMDYFNTETWNIVEEYGLVQVLPENVKTGNSIHFFMIKNCFQLTSCGECVKGVTNSNCIWCPILQKCTDPDTIEETEWVHSSCPTSTKGQSYFTCLSTSHMKVDVENRPDWIGSESLVHQSMSRLLEDEYTNEMVEALGKDD